MEFSRRASVEAIDAKNPLPSLKIEGGFYKELVEDGSIPSMDIRIESVIQVKQEARPSTETEDPARKRFKFDPQPGPSGLNTHATSPDRATDSSSPAESVTNRTSVWQEFGDTDNTETEEESNSNSSTPQPGPCGSHAPGLARITYGLDGPGNLSPNPQNDELNSSSSPGLLQFFERLTGPNRSRGSSRHSSPTQSNRSRSRSSSRGSRSSRRQSRDNSRSRSHSRSRDPQDATGIDVPPLLPYDDNSSDSSNNDIPPLLTYDEPESPTGPTYEAPPPPLPPLNYPTPPTGASGSSTYASGLISPPFRPIPMPTFESPYAPSPRPTYAFGPSGPRREEFVIQVVNVQSSTTVNEMYGLFTRAARITLDSGVAKVVYFSRLEADTAIRELDNFLFNGSRIQCARYQHFNRHGDQIDWNEITYW